MIINLRRTGTKFHKTGFRESYAHLRNPGCGWYHMYTFHMEQFQKELYLECEDEELVLLLMDIGCFRQTEISGRALEEITRILTFFQSKGKGMILRFAYDTEGNGMLKEPESSSLVKTHMRQLGSVIRVFCEDILVIQGIFVGSWGEMHDSRFLSERWMTELAETMLEAVDYRCELAVRTPKQWRMIAKNSSEKVRRKLTLFNDGIFGSETDLGTYDEGEREEELRWQQEHVRCKINGGEVLGAKECMKAEEDMAKMHLSYLNSTYNKDALDRWKSERVWWKSCGKEVSAYTYLGEHLGYRFVVRDAVFRRGELRITVENCGFANIYEEVECRILFQTEQGMESFLHPDTDARDWDSRKCSTFSVKPDRRIISKGTKCYLQLQRKRDGRYISFANEGGEKQVLIGQF